MESMGRLNRSRSYAPRGNAFDVWGLVFQVVLNFEFGRATRKVMALSIGIYLLFGICHLEFSLFPDGSKNRAKNFALKRRFWTP